MLVCVVCLLGVFILTFEKGSGWVYVMLVMFWLRRTFGEATIQKSVHRQFEQTRASIDVRSICQQEESLWKGL